MEFQPRKIVNSSLLSQSIGKTVSILFKKDSMDSTGKMLKGQTTDAQNLNVILADPLNTALYDWVEVIGQVKSQDTIQCKEIILIEYNESDEPFDTESHNMLIQYLHNYKDLYRTQ